METLTLVREAAGAVIAFIGLIFVFGGGLGLLRFPDVYTRLHAATASDGPGAALVVFGLAVMAPDLAMAGRLVLLALLIVALGPVFAHLAGSAAHAGGVAPIAGKYAAPRPGARAERTHD
ncbi:MAG TPA: monovalent cation/H(+) antiporter subunit G [Vitreimonas sp.]|uniref:monovalent cation/H(+) antiporter subunit G n=1 Tax=Vitreimonas sp. TaxID=3069702 RepID=UPI002D3A8627|nr:monovalent cation/H(+) antiporter subunit G [Vitreimonas sp.]HYD89157.1 monovalent cation/H(+) antiporter subunit G [Vitreimonas sp.]